MSDPQHEPEVILTGIAKEMMPEVRQIVDEIGIDQVRENIRRGLEQIAARNPHVRAMVDEHYKEPLPPGA